MATIPHSRGWKTLARGIRGVLVGLPDQHEMFDLTQTADRLRGLSASLNPPTTSCSHCKRCKCQLFPQLHVATVDIDQAFEACESKNVGVAWVTLTEWYSRIHSCSRLLIRRGRKFCVQHAPRCYGRGWWSLSLDQLHRGLVSATTMSLICFGHLVFP